MVTKIMLIVAHLGVVAVTCFIWIPVAIALGNGDSRYVINMKNCDSKTIYYSNASSNKMIYTEQSGDVNAIIFITKDFYRAFKQRAITTYGKTISLQRVTVADIKQLLYDSLIGSNKAYGELLKNKYDKTLDKRISDILEEKYDNTASPGKLASDLSTILDQLKTDITIRKDGPRMTPRAQ